jgi:hypothetical protein
LSKDSWGAQGRELTAYALNRKNCRAFVLGLPCALMPDCLDSHILPEDEARTEPFALPPERWLEIQVEPTMLGNRWVYEL